MITFNINEYLSLRLENNHTNVYVKEKRFRQCMYLLLNIPVSKVEDFEEIDSIDKAAEKLDHSMERSRFRCQIKPETEFVAHCSNIQAWAENNYDTRILHRNIAFPLLRELANVGDPKAKKVFKDEIAWRFSCGHIPVMQYIIQGNYLKELNKEELNTLIKDLNTTEFYNQRIELIFPIIQKLEGLGYFNSKEILRRQIKFRFEKGIARDINYLLRFRGYNYGYNLNHYFTPEEQKELVNKIDLKCLIDNRAEYSLPLLKHLLKLGNDKANKTILNKIISSFQERRYYDIRYIIRHRFLSWLSDSQLRELFDDSVYNFIFDLRDRRNLSILKYLPNFVIKSERTYEFITNALTEKYYAYKSQAAQILIENFFDRGYVLIENIVKNYPNKINRIIVEALINSEYKKSNELLKYINWARYWQKSFLRKGNERIGLKKAHKILLENDFKVVDTRKNSTVYEFCSHQAYKELSDQIAKFNENPIIEFNYIEKALIRDAKLILPSLPLLDVEYGPNKKLSIMLHFTRYIKEFIFTNNKCYYYFHRSERTQDLFDVLNKKNKIIEGILQKKPIILKNFYTEFEKFEKKLEQYYHDCKTLKAGIEQYLTSTPQLMAIKNLNVEYKEKIPETYRKVYPSTFKPCYNENTNTLILYEAHQWGKYHADSHIKIHESGVLLIFVNTFVNYSKRCNYHNAQVYFFFPKLKRFYTRKANLVRNMDKINNWEISITNLFGYEFLKKESIVLQCNTPCRPQPSIKNPK